MKKFIILLITLCYSLISLSQERSLTVSAPNMVAVGESFQLVFTLNDSRDAEFKAPSAITGFITQVGPTAGTKEFHSSVNGGPMTSNYSTTLMYYLYGNTEGKYTIPEIEAVYEGKTYKSNAFTIEVVKTKTNSNQGQQSQQGQPSQQSQGSSSQPQSTTLAGNEVLVRLEPTKSSLYRGDNLVLTVMFYYDPQVGISGLGEYKFPTYNGFFSQEVVLSEAEQKPVRRNVNGQIYEAVPLQRFILYPQQSGDIKIDPFEATAVIQVVNRARVRNQLDLVFGSPVDVHRKRMSSGAITIKVKDLPGNAPASYSGAVGSFKMEASLSRESVVANDAVSLNINISGTGNVKLAGAPKISLPPDFEKFDPKITDNVKGTSGSKRIEQVMIPRSAGTFTIPAIEFSYFDPSAGNYVTLRSKDLTLEVEKDPNALSQSSTTVSGGAVQKDITRLGTDIQFIKTGKIELREKGKYFFGSLLFYLLYLIFILVFVLVYFILKKQIKQNANVVFVKNKQANKIARKRLKTSEALMKKGNASGFYEELLRAIWGYLSDKLNIPLSKLSRDTVQELLVESSVEQQDIDALVQVIDECEFARYAPGTGQTQMEQVFAEAIQAISKFEQKIK